MKIVAAFLFSLCGIASAQTNTSLEISNVWSWADSKVISTIDSKVKSYRIYASASQGDGVSTVVGELTFDTNGNGGLGAAGYFVTTLKGAINPNGLNDGVGLHATVRKENAGWAFGLH